jgi:Flp pilus assembly protein TadG
MKTRNPNSAKDNRRGAVAVEFAIVAPVLVTLVFGMIEITRAYDMQNLLNVAGREGARFACLDKDGLLQSGQTANQKLVSDVKNFLVSNGIPSNSITVEVKDFDVPTKDFDLSDVNNDLKLFTVRITVPFSSVSLRPSSPGHVTTLTASVVFRNSKATISE